MTARSRVLAGAGAAQLALWVPILAMERRMARTGGGGIVPFELAGTPERARRTMAMWGDDGRAAARTSLLLDFPFLASYTTFNVALCGVVADALGGRGRRLAPAACVAAGACDAIENAALLGVLAGRDERLPGVARAFARTKFALLGAAIAYGAAGLAAWVHHR